MLIVRGGAMPGRPCRMLLNDVRLECQFGWTVAHTFWRLFLRVCTLEMSSFEQTIGTHKNSKKFPSNINLFFLQNLMPRRQPSVGPP